MDALELADELDKSRQEPFTSEYLVGQAATMLRQQQAEIEKLKAEKIRAYDNGYEDGRKPNTHPTKTLTDEEIKSEAMYFCHSYHSENPERLVLFARAILRKAQEK